MRPNAAKRTISAGLMVPYVSGENVKKELYRWGRSSYLLDGDNVCHGLCTAFILPYRKDRQKVRSIFWDG